MANEKRLIDANVLVRDLRRAEGFRFDDKIFAVDIVNGQDTVDAVEVVHGRWKKAHIAGYLKCNCCEDAFVYEEWLKSGKWSYCPNCGAKMDGDGNA